MQFARPKIQGFKPAADLMAGASILLRWPEVVSTSEAAARHRTLENPGGGYSGPWQNERAPFAVRPMDCLSSGDFRIVAVMGPSQVVKSEIANNWLLQSVIYDQADFMWLQTDRDMMRAYVQKRINPMIRLTPELRKRLLPERSADNTFMKMFQGATVFFVWPVAGHLQSHPVSRFVIDDYDRVKQDIDGQGDPKSLLEARQTTFEGSEVGYIASSPVLGPKAGIEALVSDGTDETFRVPCGHCGEYFAPDLETQLRFNVDGTPEEAKDSAHIVCPVNGCVIEPQEKPAMLAAGVWAGPEQKVTPDGKVKGKARETSIASFRLDGLIGFSSWGRLAELFRSAQLTFERRQDEDPLRTFINTRAGKNYTSRVEGLEPIEADDLAGRRDDYRLAEVPAGVEVLTAAVDVQCDRFEIMVKGWGPDFESWIVDRFAVKQLADGRTDINPALNPEHWLALLERVIWARYPVAGSEDVMAVLTTSIDTGGIGGVSQNAQSFWKAARNHKVPSSSITLIKGGNNPNSILLPPSTPLELDRKGRPKKSGPYLWVPNVNQIKDIIHVRLHRAEPGPGYIHIPADLDVSYIAELVAEVKEGRFWVKVGGPNETLDLEVYNIVAIFRMLGVNCDLSKIPTWARRPKDGAAAPAKEKPTVAPALPADHPFMKVQRNRRRRGARGKIGG